MGGKEVVLVPSVPSDAQADLGASDGTDGTRTPETVAEILMKAFCHPAQVSPDQSAANHALKLTSSGKDLGKSDRSLCRLQLNFDR